MEEVIPLALGRLEKEGLKGRGKQQAKLQLASEDKKNDEKLRPEVIPIGVWRDHRVFINPAEASEGYYVDEEDSLFVIAYQPSVMYAESGAWQAQPAPDEKTGKAKS